MKFIQIAIIFVVLISLTFPAYSGESDKGEKVAKKTEQPAESENVSPEKKSKEVVTDKILWKNYSEGMMIGKRQHKKIFLNFYADWCKYCKLMEKKTFVDKKIIAYLNEHFVSIKVNSDKNRKLSQKYNVRGLPLFWFVTPDGKPIGNQPGYMTPEKFLPILKFIQTDSYKKMKYPEYLKTL